MIRRPAAAALTMLLAIGPAAGCAGQPSGPPPAAVDVASGDPDAGKEVFAGATPACTTCHALADAGARGGFGPDLDRLAPDAERVAAAVQRGPSGMPSYVGELSEQEIADVAAYVATATRGD